MRCKVCKNNISSYTTRESYQVINKTIMISHIPKHVHYGNPTYKYGLCTYSHYNKMELIRMRWHQCKICENHENTLKKKREYLAAKQRKKNKEIPSYLRGELEKFEAKMMEKVKKEVKDAISELTHKKEVKLITYPKVTKIPFDE